MALTDNLVRYFKLDESSGNTTDEIGSYVYTNNGTITYSAGKINNGADFDGSNDYFNGSDVGLPSGNTDYSVSAWVNITTLADHRNIFTYGTRANYQSFGFTVLTTGVLWCDIFNEGKGSTTTISTGTLTHVAVTYTASTKTLQFYKNGTAIESATYTNTPNRVLTGTSYIGINNDASTQKMLGQIDEVGMWSRVLSGAEITSLYNSGAGFAYPFVAAAARSIESDVILFN